MSKLAVIGGKRMRAPDLERLDAMVPARQTSDTAAASGDGDRSRAFKAGIYLDKDAPRTWARDKALLVALGVDGAVPFHVAAKNAGLVHAGGALDRHGKQIALHVCRAANDNHKIAAEAA